MMKLLLPIVSFSEYHQKVTAADHSEERQKALKAAIVPSTRKIHKYWLARRAEFAPGGTRTPSISQKPAGVNNPCPCGSGMKYKKCCMGRKSHS